MRNTYVETNFLTEQDPQVIIEANDKKLEALFAQRDTQALGSLFGKTLNATQSVREELQATASNTTRLMDIRSSMEAHDLDSLAAVAHLENVRGISKTAAYIKAARNRSAENYDQASFEKVMQNTQSAAGMIKAYKTDDPARMARRESYARHIENLGALGWSVEEIREQIENRKIWDTFTPHPTKDKNKAGQDALNKTVVGNNAEIDAAQNEMLSTPLTPRLKDGLQDETNAGLDALDTYMDGAIDYLQDLQWALDEVLNTADKKQSFDLRDTAIDLAPRDWYAGDADGKLVPAGVLFAKRLQGAVRGIEKYLSILEEAPTGDRGSLNEAIETFHAVRDRLIKIESNAENLNEKEELDKAITEFSAAFSENGLQGLGEDIGPQWTGKVMQKLRDVSGDEFASDAARNAAQRVTLLHRQVGIAVGRQEIRHSGDDYNQIFDNLFEYLQNNPDNFPGIKDFKGTDPLSERGEKTQIRFYKALMAQPANEVQALLKSANNGNLKGPAAEIFSRFRVVQKTFNQSRMGVAIIAEANAMSCVQQQVMAEAFHIKGMAHCALNETEETIRDAPKNLMSYLKNFGQSNLEFRRESVQGDNGHPDVYVVVMDPASDSHKSWGLSMKEQQAKSWKNISKLGFEFGTAALYKIGTGLSYARGGFPPEMVPRLHLNVLSRHVDFAGLGKNARSIYKKQMSMVSTTIQGRGPGILRGSAQQVQDALANIGFEMDAACLAIDGKIAARDIAPLAVKYTPGMKKFLDSAEQRARTHYHDVIRHEESDLENDQTVENQHTKKVSAAMMALLTNVSARKASRSDGDGGVDLLKYKDTGEQRAIGQNVAKEWTESLYDGWYELGSFLSRARDKFSIGDIERADLTKLAGDSIYTRHKWGNAMLSLAKADCEWGMDKLALDKKGELPQERWTVGKLLQAVKDEYQVYDPYKRSYVKMDECEKRQAQIAYEAIVASSHMEALLNTAKQTKLSRLTAIFTSATKQKDMRLSERDIILNVYDENDTLETVKFGKKTRALYPGIEKAQRDAREERLMRAMNHEGERRIRELSDKGEHLEEGGEDIQKFRHIAMARRSQGPLTIQTVMDTPGVTFGARPQPIESILGNMAERASRWARMIGTPVNDRQSMPQREVA